MKKNIWAMAFLAVLAVVVPAMAQEECTTEDFPGLPHDTYLGVIGGLNFNNNFAGFDQATWFSTYGSNLWPDCADAVVWMPADGGIFSTDQQLTRVIDFTDSCCRLTSIRVAAHHSVSGEEVGPGDLTIRALDSSDQQIGDAVVYEDLEYSDGCVLINTNWTECAAKIEITYSRGSELGIIEMSYCCGEEETGGDGCTPGYWKANLKKLGGNEWTIPPNTDFDSYFGVNYFNPNITFAQAISLGGGGVNALARHAVAAVLSASSSGVDYPYTIAEIIAMVQAGGEANKDLLDAANNLGCPLDNSAN